MQGYFCQAAPTAQRCRQVLVLLSLRLPGGDYCHPPSPHAAPVARARGDCPGTSPGLLASFHKGDSALLRCSMGSCQPVPRPLPARRLVRVAYLVNGTSNSTAPPLSRTGVGWKALPLVGYFRK